MSLLDDVSIVVTPNGYKAGRLYGVLPVPTEGSELLTNGDFSSGITGWNAQTGWDVTTGSATCDGTNAAYLFQSSGSLPIGKLVIVTVNITSYTSGTLRLGATGVGIDANSVSGIGTHTVIFTTISSGTSDIELFSQNFIGSIDNVSVKEFTASDMSVTRATAATRVDENGLVNYAEVLGDNTLTGNNSTFDTGIGNWYQYSGASLVHNNTLKALEVTLLSAESGARIDNTYVNAQVGKTYKISADIWRGTTTDTSFKIFIGNVQTDVTISDTQTNYVVYLTPSSTAGLFIYRAGSGNAGTFYIDNVKVEEVTRNNVPRIDYTGGGCPHILAEPQRTNELTQSNQFDTTWNQSGTLTSGQDGVGGSTDAWKFQNPNSTSSLYQPDTTSGVQTLSAYFKKNSNYGVRFFAFGSVNCSTYFDLNNGAVVSVLNSTAKIETVGDDWFRCSMTFDQTNTRCDFYVTNNASTQVLGDYTIQYAQLEQGSYATSYIPTSGSTVTRNQDIFTRDGIGSLINSTEGVLFVEMAALSDDSDSKRITISDGTLTNRITISIASNIISGFINVNNVTQYTFYESGITTTDFNKIAIKYKANDFSVWINGVEYDVQTSGSTFSTNTLNTLNFSNATNLSNFLFGKVKQLQVYDTALTDMQLIQLTGTSGTDFYESYSEMAETLTYTIQ